MTCSPFKGPEREFGERFPPRGSRGITVNLANLLGITPKEQFVPQQNRIIVWGRPEAASARSPKREGGYSPARVCLGNYYLASFESKVVLLGLCVHQDQTQCTVSIDALPFRKLFIDKAAGPDSRLPYSNCSLLSENKPTRQELLLLLMTALPFGEWSILCPTYIISKTWRNICFSL